MPNTFSPFEIVDGDPASGIIFLCDHARNNLPEEYGDLGLPASAFERHIAYDIGAEALTRKLAKRLDAPLIHSCFSRLLIDPNRGEDDPTIVMRLSDGTIVPGNHPISDKEIRGRINRFYAPYHRAITEVIDASLERNVNPIIFSVHSFTPGWKSVQRMWDAAMLWDADPRLPRFMIEGLQKDPQLTIGDNEPYDGCLRNDTMYKHATKRGLAQGLLEVRQDLISETAGVELWADRIAPLLEAANQQADMHEVRYFGSRSDKPIVRGERHGRD